MSADKPTKRKAPKYPSVQTVERALDQLLEGYYPPPAALFASGRNKVFTRRQDDTDGERGPEHQLTVGFTPDMDAWVLLPGLTSLRFRTSAGGGQSERVQKALVILAEAIRRDNAERPQKGEQPTPDSDEPKEQNA